MKFRASCLIVLSSIILVGCGSDSTDSDIPEGSVSFDQFTLTSPAGFLEIPSQLVENRQITNQVLYAAKQEITEDTLEQDYEINLLVTTSQISPDLTFDQFTQVNLEKIQQYIIGFEAGTKEIVTFDCQDIVVQGIQTTFTIEDEYYKRQGTYLFYQYQFVANQKGYIISLAGDPSQEKIIKKTFENIIDSLGCEEEANE